MKHIDNLLKDVISEAREIGIPVPANIYKEVIINRRPKKRFGCCRRIDGVFKIEISEFILKCDQQKIKQVIAHEVLHTCDSCYEHGKLWKKYASIMNDIYDYDIKRVASFAEMGLPEEEKKQEAKYIIKCRSCGREYPRQRFTCVMKKINAYRCSCGGRLMLIEK